MVYDLIDSEYMFIAASEAIFSKCHCVGVAQLAWLALRKVFTMIRLIVAITAAALDIANNLDASERSTGEKVWQTEGAESRHCLHLVLSWLPDHASWFCPHNLKLGSFTLIKSGMPNWLEDTGASIMSALPELLL